MIAHESTSERDDATDDPDDRRRSTRLTNVELRVGTLKLPPMWEIRNLAVKLRLAPTSGPYATTFRILVALLAALVIVRVVHLAL